MLRILFYAISSHCAFNDTVLASLLQEMFWNDLHMFLNRLYSHLGLLTCTPENDDLLLHCSLS